MTICPVALAIGCKRCPIFAVCPAKSIIGDQPTVAESASAEPEPPSAKRRAKPKGKGRRRS
jgi:hypothetical protein